MRLSLLRQWGIYENSEMQDFSLFRKQQHSQCIFWEYWFIYHYLLLIFILWWWVIFSRIASRRGGRLEIVMKIVKIGETFETCVVASRPPGLCDL